MDKATMTGSEKQVTWAETIRGSKLSELEKLMASVPEAKTDAERAGKADVEARVAHLYGITSAAWWIDHRDLGPRYLLRQAYDK